MTIDDIAHDRARPKGSSLEIGRAEADASGGNRVHTRDSMTGQAAAAERVLVVDDEPVLRDALCRFLRRGGFVVVEVTSVTGALDELVESGRRNVFYDHAVIDLVLQDGDGEDVMRSFETISPRTNIVVLSGNIDSRRALHLAGRCLYCRNPRAPTHSSKRSASGGIRSWTLRSNMASPFESAMPSSPLRTAISRKKRRECSA
jgi:CheY-like chemotaxis protein